MKSLAQTDFIDFIAKITKAEAKKAISYFEVLNMHLVLAMKLF